MSEWHAQVQADAERLGPDKVIEAIVDTCKVTDDRNMPAESRTALRWNGYAWWALPRALSVADDKILLIDGYYFRSWVCALNGVIIDGHLYVNEGSGACQVCGE